MIKKLIKTLSSSLASFQNGVDSIVAKCTSCGSTPTENTPSGINTAIQTIYTDRYNLGYSKGDKKHSVYVALGLAEGVAKAVLYVDGTKKTEVSNYGINTSVNSSTVSV